MQREMFIIVKIDQQQLLPSYQNSNFVPTILRMDPDTILNNIASSALITTDV